MLQFNPFGHRLSSFFMLLIIITGLIPLSALAYEEQLIKYLEQGEKAEGYQWLLENAPQYQDDPRFYDLLAQLALALNDFAGAAEALKKLIALQPNHLGARLDLVIAYRQQGELDLATQALKDLLKATNYLEQIPANVADAIAQLEKELILTPRQKHFFGEFELALGRDSNVNQGSEINSFLIGPQHSSEIVLSEESVAAKDGFLSYLLQAGASSSNEQCHTSFWCGDVYGYAGQKLHHDLRIYDQTDLGLMGSLKLSGNKHPLYVSVFGFQSDSDAFGTDDVYGLELRKHWKYPATLYKVALSSSVNKNNLSTLPDRQQTAVSLQISRSRFTVQLLGAFLEQPARVPGDTWRGQAAVTGWLPYAGWLIKGSMKYVYLKDTEPFAGVFFGDAVRKEEEYSASARVAKALTKATNIAFEVRYSSVTSNIPIFDRSRLVVSTSLNYRW